MFAHSLRAERRLSLTSTIPAGPKPGGALMKPASQLMAAMTNQSPPELHGGQVVGDCRGGQPPVPPSARNLSRRQAWSSTEALAAAKEEWIKEFAAEDIRTLEQIEFGIEKCPSWGE
ncbi:replication protein P [Pseudomonas protegens]|uniref:replication protein P n=1 Tax=Pseudomonas protegens TaxID=380021 RepID=UPI003817E86A